MEISIQEKKIKLVEPMHVDKRFLQETRYMFKRLPNALINTPIYMGMSAAVSTIIPADPTSRAIIATFSVAAFLTGGALGLLKAHYNAAAKEHIFETENNAYIENFTKRRFKSLMKLEKAKKNNQDKNVELEQKYLVEDTARVLLQYVDDCDKGLAEIKKEFENFITEHHVEGEDLFAAKFIAAQYRRPFDRDKHYILKVLGDNLDLFDLCESQTKRNICNHMLDYEQYMLKDIEIEEEHENVPISAQKNQYSMSVWKSLGKQEMELCEESNGIFEELGMPYEYKFFDNPDVVKFCERVDKFSKDLIDEEKNACSNQLDQNDKFDFMTLDDGIIAKNEDSSKLNEIFEIFGLDEEEKLQ